MRCHGIDLKENCIEFLLYSCGQFKDFFVQFAEKICYPIGVINTAL